MVLPGKQERYTYQDYLTWSDDERWEIIGGQEFTMLPAPGIKHQILTGNIFGILRNQLSGKECRPLVAPTDVILSDEDVVQPDVLVVCDKTKITDKNVKGAPDLVVEVNIPSTSKRDHWDKKRLYEKSGVREYLLVDPDGNFVERFVLEENGLFSRGEVFDAQDEIRLSSLPGITLPLWEVFETPKPEVES